MPVHCLSTTSKQSCIDVLSHLGSYKAIGFLLADHVVDCPYTVDYMYILERNLMNVNRQKTAVFTLSKYGLSDQMQCMILAEISIHNSQ